MTEHRLMTELEDPLEVLTMVARVDGVARVKLGELNL